ncbi:MAG: asparagine synthase (glutamine-hydrolyzing) [Marinilabiliales bacterium]|nr:MAG: asparagine synthase (glutamine-hydrolyzing) [Marinilabiliales bacterium]
MCGIAGTYHLSSDRKPIVRKMMDLQVHRGPDAGDMWHHKNVCFGHRRLSIIDLSDAALQPMHSHCGRYTIVFNGEVYNFITLKAKLQIEYPEKYPDNAFKSTSDTEIVLEMFARYGPESAKELNGMFAFAVYDKQEDKVFLFRDSVGIKPLFYSVSGQNLYFSSELRPLLQSIPETTLNRKALPLYFHLGYFPGEETVVSEIKRVPAGTYGEFKNGEIQFTRFRYLPDSAKKKLTEPYSEIKKELDNKLRTAVEGTLISDVPLGVFLSGGIDSSLVSAYASELSSKKLKSFTIASPDKNHDESSYAREIAKHLGLDHIEMMLSEKEAKELCGQLLNDMDEPLADSSFIPTYFVSALARRHVTVSLSGDGGDELFMGYGSYRWAKRINNPLYKIGAAGIRPFVKNSSSPRWQKANQYFDRKLKAYQKSNLFALEHGFFTSKDLENINLKIQGNFPPHIGNKALSAKEQQALFDLEYYLRDDLLVKVDRASMLTSLEVRPPLLDHNIVAYALQIPTKKRSRGQELKSILKDLLSDKIPGKLIDRPKRGFSIPLKKWLEKDLNNLVEKHVRNPESPVFRAIDYSACMCLLKGKNTVTSADFWAVIVLSHFLEKHSFIEL